jgi:hypothetical protein
MQRLSIAAIWAALLLIVVGCAAGPSLNEFYTERSIVQNDNIVGVWQQDPTNAKANDGRSEKPSEVTISPLGQRGYLLTLSEHEAKKTEANPLEPSYQVTLFKAGDSLFADVTLAPELKKRLEETYVGMVIVTHTVMRIDLEKDRLSVRPVSDDVARHFTFAAIGKEPAKQANQITVSLSPTRVMTDPPEKLFQGVLRADAAGCFAGPASMTYTRVKAK